MTLAIIGVNHKTAPIALRERIAIGREELPEATRVLAAMPGVAECMIVSTCNRVELVAVLDDPAAQLSSFLTNQFEITIGSLASTSFRVPRPGSCVNHPVPHDGQPGFNGRGCRPQILGQVKEAFAVARAAGTVSSQLEHLLQCSFAAAKKVRTETGIGSNSVSVASVAVDMARKIFGSLQGRTVFLVGAGKMSEIAARHLVQQGAGAILVSNRTEERARTLAGQFNGRVIRFDQLDEAASEADIIASAPLARPCPSSAKSTGQAFLLGGDIIARCFSSTLPFRATWIRR